MDMTRGDGAPTTLQVSVLQAATSTVNRSAVMNLDEVILESVEDPRQSEQGRGLKREATEELLFSSCPTPSAKRMAIKEEMMMEQQLTTTTTTKMEQQTTSKTAAPPLFLRLITPTAASQKKSIVNGLPAGQEMNCSNDGSFLKHENMSHPKEEKVACQPQGGAGVVVVADYTPSSSSSLKQETGISQSRAESKSWTQEKHHVSPSSNKGSNDDDCHPTMDYTSSPSSLKQGTGVSQSHEEGHPMYYTSTSSLKHGTGVSQSQDEENLSQSCDEQKKQSKKNNNDSVDGGFCEHPCEFVPHPTLLQHCICINCKNKTKAQKLFSYIKQRKIFNQQRDLVKVVARLDPTSMALVKSIRQEFNIKMDKLERSHVVLAGSLTRENAMALRNHLVAGDGSSCCLAFTACSGTVVCGKSKTRKYYLELTVNDARSRSTLEKDRQHLCVLPQWPLSIFLGLIPKKMADALKNRLINVESPTITFNSVSVDIVHSSFESSIPVVPLEAALNLKYLGRDLRLYPPMREENDRPQKQATSDNNECCENSEHDENAKAIGTDSAASLKQSHDEKRNELPAMVAQEKSDNATCEACERVLHPTLFHCCICINCKTETGNQNLMGYSQNKKIFQQKTNLVKVVARLDPSSQALLKSIREVFQFQSGDDSRCGDHIVLAGSLTHEKALEMRHRLTDTRLKFSVLAGGSVAFSIDKTKEKCFLFRLAVKYPLVASTLESERQQSYLLPQWPLSLVLGYREPLGKSPGSLQAVLNERLNSKQGWPAITFSSHQIDVVESSCESTIHIERMAAAVKKRACQEGCKSVPHPEHLGRLVCVNCGTVTILKQLKNPQYRDARKIYNLENHLVKVVARLDRPSLKLVESFRAEFPIREHPMVDSRPDHIVLVGSLTRENALDLRTRLRHTRFRFAVSGAVGFPVSRCDGKYEQCYAVKLTATATDPAMTSILKRERNRLCLLPQWPVSLILGWRESSESLKTRFIDNNGRAIKFRTMDIDILDYSGKSIIHPQEEALTSVADEEKEEGEVTDKEHEPIMDTMVALEADCLGTRTADPMQCDTCNFIPHPTEIEAVVCCLCGLEKNPCDSIVWYNDNRRQFLLDRKAVAISAKLDERSRAVVASVFLNPPGNDMDCSTAPPAGFENITLVEGLMDWSAQSTSPLLVDIHQTVQIAPALEIVGSRCIGELSGQQLLVVDVRPDPRLAAVLYEASQQSLVAQYPLLHVSCGMVPCEQAKAITERVQNELVGQSLVLHATSVNVQPVS